MSTLVFVDANGITCIYDVGPGQTAASQAATVGITDPAFYQEFDSTDFDPACYNFPSAFTLSGGVVGFDLPTAKVTASTQAKVEISAQQQTALNGYTAEAVGAQIAYPAGSRIPAIADVIAEVNGLSFTLQTQLTAIEAATTINEVNNVLHPPTGSLFTGRGTPGPDDIIASYYTAFDSISITESETELYIPVTSTVIPYVSGGFAATTNVFADGDFYMQIRETATGYVLAEFNCPDEPLGALVSF